MPGIATRYRRKREKLQREKCGVFAMVVHHIPPLSKHNGGKKQ
jgi:hypothetical protein